MNCCNVFVHNDIWDMIKSLCRDNQLGTNSSVSSVFSSPSTSFCFHPTKQIRAWCLWIVYCTMCVVQTLMCAAHMLCYAWSCLQLIAVIFGSPTWIRQGAMDWSVFTQSHHYSSITCSKTDITGVTTVLSRFSGQKTNLFMKFPWALFSCVSTYMVNKIVSRLMSRYDVGGSNVGWHSNLVNQLLQRASPIPGILAELVPVWCFLILPHFLRFND